MSMWRVVYLSIGASLLPGISPACASIEVSPSIQISQYWTDNRELTADELSQEDTITEIQPEIALTLTSRRHRGELEARYQYLTYRRADETRNFQQYNASTN